MVFCESDRYWSEYGNKVMISAMPGLSGETNVTQWISRRQLALDLAVIGWVRTRGRP